MQKFEQDIQNHQDNIRKSIGSSFPTESTPRLPVAQLEDLKKGHDVYSIEKLNNYVASCQESFIKGLESGGDIDSLKKGLTEAQNEISTLRKVIIFDENQKETTYFVKQK